MKNSTVWAKLCSLLFLTLLLLSACQPTSQQPATILSDEKAQELMTILSSDSTSSQAADVLRQIKEAGDQRFVAVLIELIRFNQIGILEVYLPENTLDTLHSLSGEEWGENWQAWVEWYGTTDLTPPPGFTTWKGEILGRIDPQFAEFLQDDFPTRIRVEEIQWGGVVVDGIPSLDYPNYIKPNQVDYLSPDDAVFGLTVKDEARAYPLRIVDWHEMVNDVVGGTYIALSYCTLCGAAIPYIARASDGHIYTFGSSGLLYRSNKLMYDRQTNTLWNQLTGEPVLGKLADSDVQLEFLPIVLTTWEEWLKEHPETYVLDINTGYSRPYVPGAAYGTYFASTETMFPVWERNDLLDTKTQVYTVQIGGIPKAYPINIVTEETVINDQIVDTNLVLIADGDLVQVDTERVSYQAGAAIRAYNRYNEQFAPGPEKNTALDSQNRIWQVTESALLGPDGETAERISGHLAYWFGWYTMFPGTLVYGIDG